jgi:hypothetical protein
MRLALRVFLLLLGSACASTGGTASQESVPSGDVEASKEKRADAASPEQVSPRVLVAEAEQRLAAEDYEGALARYRQAERLGGKLGNSRLYNAAWAASLAGHHDESVEWLRKAIDAGFEDLPHIQSDPDLDAIREHPGYLEQVARLEALRAAQDGPLRDELLAMMEEDQAAREALSAPGARQRNSPARKRVVEVDTRNTARLKELVAEKGWPRISQVGKEAARAAWLLAQHADRDPAFQREILTLMEAAVEEGEAEPHVFAYLTDRVLLAEGKPQRYGTQTILIEGVLRPRALESVEQAARLREQVGLGDLEGYIREVADLYGVPASMEAWTQ